MITPNEGLSNSHHPAMLIIGESTVFRFLIEAAKVEQFVAAADVLGETPDALIQEAVDLCLDTSIAKALHKLG